MKKLFLVFAMLCAAIAFSQSSGTPVQYSEVVTVPDEGKTARELYSSAKLWFTKSFKSSKDVIELDDPDSHTLVGKGTMKYNSAIFMGSGSREGFVHFDVTIACKDGRYKYEFSNFVHKGRGINMGLVTTDEELPTLTGWNTGGPSFRKKISDETRQIIDQNILPLISLLQQEMGKPSISKEDW